MKSEQAKYASIDKSVFQVPPSVRRLSEQNLSEADKQKSIEDTYTWLREVREAIESLSETDEPDFSFRNALWAAVLENCILGTQHSLVMRETPQRKGGNTMRAKAERRAEVIRAAYEKAVAMHPSYNFSKIVSCIHEVPEVDVSTRSIIATLKALGITGRSHKAAKRGN